MHKVGEQARFRIAPERLVPRCGRAGFYEPDQVHEELWSPQHDQRLRDGSILPYHDPPAAESPAAAPPAAEPPAAEGAVPPVDDPLVQPPAAEAEHKRVSDEGAPKDSP